MPVEGWDQLSFLSCELTLASQTSPSEDFLSEASSVLDKGKLIPVI